MTRAVPSPTALAGRPERPATVPVWDPVVRVFHWSLVASFAVAWFSEDSGRLHETAGYVVLTLVAIRLVWGFVGTRHARFRDFVPSPATLTAYLRDMIALRAKRHLGHNPAGSVMIVLLLVMLVLTGGSGWLMTTDAFWGVEWVEELHEAAANLTLALVFLHLAGVLVSSLMHRENLVLAMITGRKRAPQH
jgi:cytochrome b